MSEFLVETRNLKKYFKTGAGLLHAVDNLNLSIKKGKTLGIVGESGCGKSTLGRTILRLHEPTSGEIYFDGEDITKYSKGKMRKMRTKMQIIFQDPYSSINPRMSVEEIIAEPMIVNKTYNTMTEIYESTDRLMEVVGLAPRLASAYPHELDGGRRQRIGIARALALSPQFIVCDEPVSALDVSIQAQVLNLLMDLQEEYNLTYMFITHDLSVVKHISDEIAVLYLGQCVETAPKESLFKNPQHPYTKALLASIPVPDPNIKNLRSGAIKGEVTSPIEPAPGCRFAPRCHKCTDECRQADPVLREVLPSHYAACVNIG